MNWHLKEIERFHVPTPASERREKIRIRYHWQRVEGCVTEADEGEAIPQPPAPSSEILDQLQAERVFEVKIVGGKIRFREACDRYFSTELTPAEVWELCEALKDLANHARREPAA